MITIPPTPSDTEAISRVSRKAAAEIWCQSVLQALGGDDAERVGGAEVGVAQRPQHRRAPRPRSRRPPRRPPRAWTRMSIDARLPNCLAEGLDRHVDHVVAALAEHAPLLGEQADHPVGSAVDQDRAADRVDLREELGLDVPADHRHRLRGALLAVEEEAAGREVQAHQRGVVGGGAVDARRRAAGGRGT